MTNFFILLISHVYAKAKVLYIEYRTPTIKAFFFFRLLFSCNHFFKKKKPKKAGQLRVRLSLQRQPPIRIRCNPYTLSMVISLSNLQYIDSSRKFRRPQYKSLGFAIGNYCFSQLVYPDFDIGRKVFPLLLYKEGQS